MSNSTANTTGRGWGRSTNMSGYAQSAPYGQYQSNGHFMPNTIADGFNDHFDPSLNNLSQSMASMLLHNVDYAGVTKQNNSNAAANGMVNMNGMLTPQTNPGLFYPLPAGSLVYSDVNGIHQGHYPQYAGGYGLNATNQGQLQQASFHGLFPQTPITSRGNGWVLPQQVAQEVPELAPPRRTSLSSNEADSPQTPLFTSYLGKNYPPGHPDSPFQICKTRAGAKWENFEAWTSASPAIPEAVPALDSPGGGRGSLEQIMNNPNETTNVYVRGLHPDTTDEMLHAYGQRFGDVVSAKSIIDTATNPPQCKG